MLTFTNVQAVFDLFIIIITIKYLMKRNKTSQFGLIHHIDELIVVNQPVSILIVLSDHVIPILLINIRIVRIV